MVQIGLSDLPKSGAPWPPRPSWPPRLWHACCIAFSDGQGHGCYNQYTVIKKIGQKLVNWFRKALFVSSGVWGCITKWRFVVVIPNPSKVLWVIEPRPTYGNFDGQGHGCYNQYTVSKIQERSSEKPNFFVWSGVWAIWPSLSLYGTFDGQGHGCYNQYIVIQKIGNYFRKASFVCLVWGWGSLAVLVSLGTFWWSWILQLIYCSYNNYRQNLCVSVFSTRICIKLYSKFLLQLLHTIKLLPIKIIDTAGRKKTKFLP